MAPQTNEPGNRVATRNVWALVLLGAVSFPAAYIVCAEPVPALDANEYEADAHFSGGELIPIPLPPIDETYNLAYDEPPLDPPQEQRPGAAAPTQRLPFTQRFGSLPTIFAAPPVEAPLAGGEQYADQYGRLANGEQFRNVSARSIEAPANQAAAIPSELGARQSRLPIGARFVGQAAPPVEHPVETLGEIEIQPGRQALGDRLKNLAAPRGDSPAPLPPAEVELGLPVDAPVELLYPIAVGDVFSPESLPAQVAIAPSAKVTFEPPAPVAEPPLVEAPLPRSPVRIADSAIATPQPPEVEVVDLNGGESVATPSQPAAELEISAEEIADAILAQQVPASPPQPAYTLPMADSRIPAQEVAEREMAEVQVAQRPELPPQDPPAEPLVESGPPAVPSPSPANQPAPGATLPSPELAMPAPAVETPTWQAPLVVDCAPPCSPAPQPSCPCGPASPGPGGCSSGLVGCHEDPALSFPSSAQADILELLAVDIARRSLLAIHPYAADRPIITLDVVVRPSGHEVHLYARLQWFRHHWYQSRANYKTYESEVSASVIYHPDHRRVYDISYVDNAYLPFPNIDMTSQVAATYNEDFALRDQTGLPPKFLSDRVDLLEPYPKPRAANNGPVMEPDPRARSLRTVRRDTNVTANQ